MTSGHKILQLLQNPLSALKPGHLADLYDAFHELIPWWFHEDVVKRIEQEIGYSFPDPQLPQDRGACWIILVMLHPQAYPLLRPAFLLPLQWRQESPHDGALPKPLCQLADEVRTAMHHAFPKLSCLEWHLFLHSNFQKPKNNSVLAILGEQFRFCSGWVALAGGLYLACNQGEPDGHVWVSACWDMQRGIQRIEHLKEKLQLAQTYKVRRLYLPQEQIEEAPPPEPPLKIEPLRQGTNRLDEALGDYLAALDVLPPVPAPDDEKGFERCQKWYLRQPTDQPDFYCTHLLPTILKRCQRQRIEECPDCQPEILLTILSDSWVLIPLTLGVFPVRECFILHTEQMHKHLAPIQETIQQMSQQALLPTSMPILRHVVFQEKHDLLTQFRSLVPWNRYPPEKILIDVTPGKKLMSFMLSRAAPARSWHIYINHETQNRKPVPGTEKLYCWRRE
jgi:hypothetical protein